MLREPVARARARLAVLVLLQLAPQLAMAQGYGAAASATRTAFDSTRSESRMGHERAEEVLSENVGDMLGQIDGLVVSRTSSISAVPILRGQTGSAVLLMADELRLNDSLTRPGGSALLNLIDPESVHELEVIRGPASVLYGSDALGGVVRVRSHPLSAGPDVEPRLSGSISARAASAERAVRASGSAHGAARALGARMSLGRGHAGSLQRGGDLGEQPFTGHDDATFAGRLELVPTRRQAITLSHQSGHFWDVPRSDVSTEDDQQSTERLDRDATVLRYSGDFPRRKLRVTAFSGMVIRRELRQRLRAGNTELERDRVLGVQLGAGVTLFPGAGSSLELGADAVLERVGSSASELAANGERSRGRGRYLAGSRYDMGALYALWVQPFAARWTLLAGARATLVRAAAPLDPLFEPALQTRLDRDLLGVVGSLGTRFDLGDDHAWLLSFLTGFRAPNLEDFQAFGGGARGFTIPNAKLREERAWTVETGWKSSRSQLQGSLFVFGTLLTDLIVRVPGTWDGEPEIDDEPVLRRANASRSLLVGAEGELRARLTASLYTALAAWAVWGETRRPDEQGRDLTEPASKLPGPTAALRLGYEHQRWAWGEAAVSVQLPQSRLSEADRMDVRLCPDGPDCERVDGYVDLTLRGGVRLGSNLAFTLAAENLLDVAYRTYASGAYAPGRSLVFGVRASL